MPRPLRVPVAFLVPGELVLPGDSARYVTRVHRLSPGDELLLFDPEQGLEAEARILSAGSGVSCAVGPLRPGSRPGFANLELALAVSKGDATEQALRDAVALGVGRIRLLTLERSVSRLDRVEKTAGARVSTRLARFSRIATEVARQCLRSDVPQIEAPMSLADVLKHTGPSVLHLVLHPEEALPLLGEQLETVSPKLADGTSLCLWIGPEGGFSPAEIDVLNHHAVGFARLGPLVLRMETATTAALAIAAHWLLQR